MKLMDNAESIINRTFCDNLPIMHLNFFKCATIESAVK